MTEGDNFDIGRMFEIAKDTEKHLLLQEFLKMKVRNLKKEILLQLEV